MEIIKRIESNDIFLIVGFLVMGYGLYLIWPPLTPLVMGFLLIIISIVGHWSKNK